MNAIASENQSSPIRGGDGSWSDPCIGRPALMAALAWNNTKNRRFKACPAGQRGPADAVRQPLPRTGDASRFGSALGQRVHDLSLDLSVNSVLMTDRPIHNSRWTKPPDRYNQEDFSRVSLHTDAHSGRIPVEPSNVRVPATGYRPPTVLSVTSIQGASQS
jgi:hypothetical protein